MGLRDGPGHDAGENVGGYGVPLGAEGVGAGVVCVAASAKQHQRGAAGGGDVNAQWVGLLSVVGFCLSALPGLRAGVRGLGNVGGLCGDAVGCFVIVLLGLGDFLVESIQRGGDGLSQQIAADCHVDGLRAFAQGVGGVEFLDGVGYEERFQRDLCGRRIRASTGEVPVRVHR